MATQDDANYVDAVVDMKVGDAANIDGYDSVGAFGPGDHADGPQQETPTADQTRNELARIWFEDQHPQYGPNGLHETNDWWKARAYRFADKAIESGVVLG